MCSPKDKRRWPPTGSPPGSEPTRRSLHYDGRGICYLEFGHGQVAKVDVTFVSGQPPVGDFDGPSELFAAEKVDFGTSRIQRWFGREWSASEQTVP